MNVVISTWFCFLIILIFVQLHECGRSSNGGGYARAGSPPRRSPPRNTPHTTARSMTTAHSMTTVRRKTYDRSMTTARSISTTPVYVGGSTTQRSNADWNLPPRPGSEKYYHQGYSGNNQPTKIKIQNNYNYHYPGYYSLPVQSHYPGYYYTPSSYHYSSHDTGSTALGFFLGYSLARLTTPTYSHYSFYDGYTPRYDHYTVHHYYHNANAVPQNQNISPNAIVGCVGDTTSVCPGNTVSLCTSNGALMCVVNAASTTPCGDDHQVSCAKSTISCVNNTAPECQNRDSTTIEVPCVSNAQVYGDIELVDNTITLNSTRTNNVESNEVVEPLTTTEFAPRGDEKRENFCVTVVALPAKKEETQGEKLFEDAKGIMSNLLENMWGL